MGITDFSFKFLVLETLSMLHNAPDRQNPTEGSSVKTLKLVSVQDTRALFTSPEPTWRSSQTVSLRLRMVCVVRSECSALTWGSLEVPESQCPWSNPPHWRNRGE